MHNKMLCTSKIDLLWTPYRVAVHNCSIMFKTTQQKQEDSHAYEQWITKLSNTNTKCVFAINPVSLWVIFIKLDIFLCLLWPPSSLKERDGRRAQSLYALAWWAGWRSDKKRGDRELMDFGAFYLQQRLDAGYVRHGEEVIWSAFNQHMWS